MIHRISYNHLGQVDEAGASLSYRLAHSILNICLDAIMDQLVRWLFFKEVDLQRILVSSLVHLAYMAEVAFEP